MGLLKRLRSRSGHSPTTSPPQSRCGRDLSSRLPDDIMTKIFADLCPHAQDDSYDTSERSAVGDGCMLCDARDLSRAAQVCRRWYILARDQLYHSVRIDAVHYCELEDILTERRQRKSFLKHHAMAGDIPAQRLSLFCRTVRESTGIASQVELLKLPYMTRETCKGDLARTVSVLPNLRYVDLPDGVSTGEPTCVPLMHELLGRCPDIRKMRYTRGAEVSLELLTRRHWQALEILELSAIAIEPSRLRIVLGSLPTLHLLTLSHMPNLDDSIFHSSPSLPPFPPLQSLTLENTPFITAQGLQTYLLSPQNREILSALSLDKTGVAIQDLTSFLWDASSLHSLTYVESVSRSLALNQSDTAPLTSISLRVLRFEITDSDRAHGLQKPSASYYSYLARSLHSNSLPALSQLYVRDPSFPERLLLPPMPVSAPPMQTTFNTNPFTQPRGISQPLHVFSKGLDELDWVFTAIAPPTAPGRPASITGGRPLSAYSASRGLGPQWATAGGDPRKSTVVGNGFGGFLAVPSDGLPRPMTADVGNARDSGVGSRAGGAAGAADKLRAWNVGGRHRATSSVTSVGSSSGGGSSASGLLRPPPPSRMASTGSGIRHSKHDLWR